MKAKVALPWFQPDRTRWVRSWIGRAEEDDYIAGFYCVSNRDARAFKHEKDLYLKGTGWYLL